ncbi:cytochrome d ubiquinol oxidase subunit 2 [Thiopseudomonas alkaliphila]|uniref:Cytochrome d ubiquinol oxidase subunit 2 n=1 Tax=Thiopseudomonas alkaliphila TaxID=1697053 RepID=A0A0K1XD33_9GAMM|nr:cytochrome d ubiquinol oxidase subunit II [Thiopseudomonas alkaliphila]AKX44602.1 cytochrome d ubiquinol oxidase subunit 2 [Thiopseudomonas alkaliphila]AKX47804.1 cytochrome d ubiquinol oxidase subunit 2 [Thiopseudomonas alkaliphila]AKX47984.1 cytochrome d ubiquinol oxidase subunit 2 [Thiopseudomonas alkaliphila]AKX51656.1 cytochrome d ubiquinol oxidase subunit 2 [Thiopseudomonas alkaliphila]AKX53120.1 cytochrome d ubiquinol oxidase subunit 2 [Thiopseudomonas alkaliphila]
MFDYETLKLIWWVLVGVLLIGFALTDGFDLGAAILIPVVGKTDNERRAVINTIAPHWDGNQVWLITAAGALFAAWPVVYAASFSGFYWAMLLVLFSLFVRPVGFDYRSKVENQRWRSSWDWGLCIGGIIPSVIFGVAFGNLLQGVPFHMDDSMRIFYTGSFWGLLNPLGLLAGIVSLSMLVMHGATWLTMRTSGAMQDRSVKAARYTALAYLVTFIGAGVYLWLGIKGYTVTSEINFNGAIDPLSKTVERTNAGWLANYSLYPITIAAPVIAIAGGLLALVSGRKGGLAFLGSSLAITGTLCTAGFAMFPFLMPSSTDFSSSLLMWDAVSSHKTLGIMMIAAGIFVPIILLYTLWSYYKMWGKVTPEHIEENQHSLY